ncbi:hypothetical protein QBC43DRAFT_287421 [Cladorrhinum sp. PSN259]|nr:hypothetical protein QBC43DRAFT_287421 [Cladorrhinum sp. PSN259]
MKPPDHESYPLDRKTTAPGPTTRAGSSRMMTETQGNLSLFSPLNRFDERGESSTSGIQLPLNDGHQRQSHDRLIGAQNDEEREDEHKQQQQRQENEGIMDRVRTESKHHNIPPENEVKGKGWSFKRAAKAISKTFRWSKGRRFKGDKGKGVEEGKGTSNDIAASLRSGEHRRGTIVRPAACKPASIPPVVPRHSPSTHIQLPYRSAPEINPALRSQVQCSLRNLQGGLYMQGANSPLATLQESSALPASAFGTVAQGERHNYQSSRPVRGAIVIQSPHPIADSYTYEEDWSHVHEAKAKAQAQAQAQAAQAMPTAAMDQQTPQIPERFSSKRRPRSFKSGSFRRTRSACGSLDSHVSWNPFDLPGPPKQTLMSDMMEVLAGTSSRLAAQSRDTLNHKASSNTAAASAAAPMTPALKNAKSRNTITTSDTTPNKKLVAGTPSPATQSSASSSRKQQTLRGSGHTNRTNMTQQDSAIEGLTPTASGEKKGHGHHQPSPLSRHGGVGRTAKAAPMSVAGVPRGLRNQRTSSSIYNNDSTPVIGGTGNTKGRLCQRSSFGATGTAMTTTISGGSGRTMGTLGTTPSDSIGRGNRDGQGYGPGYGHVEEGSDYTSFLAKNSSKKKRSGESMSLAGDSRAWWTESNNSGAPSGRASVRSGVSNHRDTGSINRDHNSGTEIWVDKRKGRAVSREIEGEEYEEEYEEEEEGEEEEEEEAEDRMKGGGQRGQRNSSPSPSPRGANTVVEAAE